MVAGYFSAVIRPEEAEATPGTAIRASAVKTARPRVLIFLTVSPSFGSYAAELTGLMKGEVQNARDLSPRRKLSDS
jgi:hypothetical protein